MAGVIAEPVIGAGGIIPPPDEYFPMLRELCDKYGLLLIFDEVMTGFGRTGKLFASEHWKVVPDIMTIGKAVTAGYLPLSAAVVRGEIAEAFWGDPDEHVELIHGHTHGPSTPINCATAIAAIEEIIEKKLPERSAQLGEYLMKRLQELERDSPIVSEVRGKGLFAAVEVVHDKETMRPVKPDFMVGRRIEEKGMEKGLALWSRMGYVDFIALCPPLIITREQIDTVVDTVTDILNELTPPIQKEG